MRHKILGIALMLTLTLVACGGGGESADPESPGGGTPAETDVASPPADEGTEGSAGGDLGEPELDELTVYAVRDPQIAAQLAVAADQGFFEDHGIAVEPRYFATGSEVAPGFVSGDVQIGMASTMAMIGTIAGGFEATMVGVVSEVAGGIGIVASEEIGYDPANLEGRKLGLINAPPLRVLLQNFDDAYDEVSLDNVELVNFNDPAALVTAFANGDIDALAIWNPAFLNATEFGNILVSGTTTYIPDGQPAEQDLFAVPIGVYTTPDFATENPNTVKAILAAFEDATEWIEANPDGLSELLSELLETPLELTQNMVDQNTYTMLVDDRTIDLMREQTTFIADLELIPENPDPESYVDLSLLREVNPALAEADIQ